MIKLDTDEFIGKYDPITNDILVNKEDIRNEFNHLVIDGNKYKCYYANSMPINPTLNPLECVHFTQPYTPLDLSIADLYSIIPLCGII
jgi:hypothetical protein